MTEQLKNYSIENLFFYNMDEHDMFLLNSKLTLEDKIAFIDRIEDNFATKMLSLMKIWVNEKDTLPQHYGSPKTVSKRAWIKRNTQDFDIRISDKMSFYFRSKEFSILSNMEDNITTIHKCFSVLCEKLKNEERYYFKAHNSFYIKLERIKEYHNEYGSLCNTVSDIYWNGNENFTEEQLDYILESYNSIVPVFEKEQQKLKAYFEEE